MNQKFNDEVNDPLEETKKRTPYWSSRLFYKGVDSSLASIQQAIEAQKSDTYIDQPAWNNILKAGTQRHFKKRIKPLKSRPLTGLFYICYVVMY